MTSKSSKISVVDVKADIKELQVYLKALKGKILLTVEGTITSQWLYTELNDSVDKLVVCDPYGNNSPWCFKIW